MDVKLLEQLSRMVQGHEIWMENPSLADGKGQVELRYGHNMASDGIPPEHMVNPLVYTPGGQGFKPEVEAAESSYVIRFPMREEGNYTVLIDSSAIWNKTGEGSYKMGPKFKFQNVIYSGAFHQMAKKIMPSKIGNDVGAPIVHGILEIIPDTTCLEVGKEAVVTVLYEGKPLTNENFKAFSKRSKKENMLVTDAQGKVGVPIDHEGEWMFLVRHKDETKKVDDEFDETVFVTTLVMETR